MREDPFLEDQYKDTFNDNIPKGSLLVRIMSKDPNQISILQQLQEEQ